MKFLHYPLSLSAGDVVEVTLDKQANVRLMDQANFLKYQRGEQHKYYGGLAKVSPIKLRVPSSGHWHVTVDLGGYAGTVRASVRVVKG